MEKYQYYNKTLKETTSPIIKRAFDLSAGVILLIILIVPLLIFSLAILIFSGKPIFFLQKRTGQNNKPFTIWKFRTMECVENGKLTHLYNWQNGVPNDFIFENPQNQNITKIGKIYRKFSIDELPQLINVLRGEMSLVGPRPEIPGITEKYNQVQSKRLKTKPGITGYAQVNGRSEISHEKKLEYDCYYNDNWSFKLDIKILLKTIRLVILGTGAS